MAKAVKVGLDTAMGTERSLYSQVEAQKTLDRDEPLFPQSPDRWRRSSDATMLAITKAFVQRTATRHAGRVIKEFDLESLPPAHACAITDCAYIGMENDDD